MRTFFRKLYRTWIVMSIVLFFSLVIFLLMGPRRNQATLSDPESAPQRQPAAQSGSAPVRPPETKPTCPPETEPIQTENTAAEAAVTTAPTETVPIAQYCPVDDRNALFIGDSRTVGLADHGDLDNANFFAAVGMSVYNVWETKIAVPKVGKVLLKELLRSKQYDIIYIMLGINGLGYAFDQTVGRYGSLVEQIRALQPEAVIVLMANIHVTAARSASDKYINNPALDRFNAATAQFADGKSVFYLDANSLFDDENGNLAEEKSADSAHLKAKFYRQWAEWLMIETADILARAEE